MANNSSIDSIDTIREQVAQRLQSAMSEIQASMAANGINASGRTSASIKVRVESDAVQLVAGGENAAPFATVEVGRAGGKVPAGFTAILEQWSRDKGLQFDSDSRRKSFAYLLGRKIAREGTARHAQPVDVYSGIAKVAAEDVRGIVSKGLSRYMVQELVHNFDNK